MTSKIAPLLLALACAGSATRTPGPPPAERAAVLAATERLFVAMRDRDTAAVRRALHPRAMLYAVRGPELLSVFTTDEFVSLVGRADQPLHERVFDPRVEVAGNVASVWAFYDFHRGDTFSHCGTDAVQLVRQSGEWRISAISYTVLTTGCPAVR